VRITMPARQCMVDFARRAEANHFPRLLPPKCDAPSSDYLMEPKM
jgi:hypothetical protein